MKLPCPGRALSNLRGQARYIPGINRDLQATNDIFDRLTFACDIAIGNAADIERVAVTILDRIPTKTIGLGALRNGRHRTGDGALSGCRNGRRRETGHMDDIRDTVECRANAVIREDFIKAQKDVR